MYLRPRGRALFPLLPRPPGGSSPLPAWTPPPVSPPSPRHPPPCSAVTFCAETPRVAPALARTGNQVASVVPPGGHSSPLPLPGAQPTKRIAWPVRGGPNAQITCILLTTTSPKRGVDGRGGEVECARSFILRQKPSVPGRRLCGPHLGTQPAPCPQDHGWHSQSLSQAGSPRALCDLSPCRPRLQPRAEIWPRGGDWVPVPGISGAGWASRPWARGRKEEPWLGSCTGRQDAPCCRGFLGGWAWQTGLGAPGPCQPLPHSLP